MSTFDLTVTWSAVDCAHCKALFAMPENVNSKYRDTHESFHCPYCRKGMYYPAESEKERYKRLMLEKDKCCISAMEKANTLERKVRAYKGVVTKLKAREV